MRERQKIGIAKRMRFAIRDAQKIAGMARSYDGEGMFIRGGTDVYGRGGAHGFVGAGHARDKINLEERCMRLFLSCRKSRSHPGHPTTFPSLSQKGASLVEFALVLPLLILITFGIIEFGIVMYNQQVITNAAREGARRGIVQVTVGNRILPAEIRQTVLTAARNDLISFTGDTLENENIAVTPEAGCTAYPQNLTVRVTYPVTFPVLRSFGIGGFDLTAESTMTCE